MKKLMDYFRGCCRLTLRGVAPERCLNRLLAAGVVFWAMAKTDEYTLGLSVYRSDVRRAVSLAQRCQCEAAQVPCRSFRSDFYGLKRRWALLLGLVLAAAGMVVLPNMIVTVTVTGCEAVEPQRIVRELSDLGVCFGTWGPSIDSVQLKNELLRRIPQLRWVAVNCSGMCANVLAAERSEPEPAVPRQGMANLVACTDGVVTELEVYAGQAVCKPGDAVRQGQLLVSGVVDLERCSMTTHALGEVYADTRRRITVLTPRLRTKRTPDAQAGCCIYLCVGRKRIKIFGSSGIMMGDCVKIMRRKALTLPGGEPLPLAVCVETYHEAARTAFSLDAAAAEAQFCGYAERWASQELVAGQILETADRLQAQADAYRFTQTLHCREMIARSVEIPILELEQHGTNDQRRTDGTAD